MSPCIKNPLIYQFNDLMQCLATWGLGPTWGPVINLRVMKICFCSTNMFIIIIITFLSCEILHTFKSTVTNRLWTHL